jgi:polyphenol oxidase
VCSSDLGVVAGVVTAAVTTMNERFNVRPGQMIAAIGPCISSAHYEVGPEVAAAFVTAGLAEAVITHGMFKPHVNLAAATVAQLQSAGVEPGNIDQTDRCTFDGANEFYSHRRDGPRAGRMAAVIAVRE